MLTRTFHGSQPLLHLSLSFITHHSLTNPLHQSNVHYTSPEGSSGRHAPPLPGPCSAMSEPHEQPQTALPPPPSPPLQKRQSWSPDVCREEAWLRRRESRRRRCRSRSVTDEDLEELRACIELGFGFDSPEVNRRLSDTLPALELFYAVNKNYSGTVLKSSPASSDCETTPSPLGSPRSIFVPGENPQTVKTRLRQWAQVVACSVRQCSFR